MNGQAYPAARHVSPTIYDYFARRRVDALRETRAIASLPDVDTIATIIDAAFWASLRREEGYLPRISLAFLSPEQAVAPLVFERALPLRAEALTKVAPAVERAGIHLGVWQGADDQLCVWGTTHTIPALCFVLEVAAPGLLVVKHHRGDEGHKFVNVAVLEGDQIKVVDEEASNLPPDCPALVASMLGFDAPARWSESVNLLVQLAVSMRAHGRGGSLLLVPDGSERWRESIVRPIPYAVSPAFPELALLNQSEPTDAAEKRSWQDAVDRSVAAVAGLTAVDGATVMTTGYTLLAFGAKIARRTGSPQVEEVIMTEPIEGGAALRVHPEHLGGTRHLAAVQFVHDQPDAVALVASQDGRFTVFAWSACELRVHAHRVETLLL
jgi:hypothetical protein